MRRKILLLLLALTIFHPVVKAQSLQLFQVDTAEEWVGGYFYFNAITLSHDKIIHSFLSTEHYNVNLHNYGDVGINTYNTTGNLLEQERSATDSLFIIKTILKANGEKIILGNAFHHVSLYDLDTMLSINQSGQVKSFIVQVDASNHTTQYQEFFPVSDMALDEANNVLYCVEQYKYDSAKVYAYNLTTGNKTVIATIDKARVNARILKTMDFIYIAGASINFGININDHQELTAFPYATFVIQLDNDGSFNWIKIIEDATTPHMDIAAAPDQGVYLGADLSIPVKVGTDSLLGPTWGGDFLLTRVDKDGHFLWATEALNNTLCGYTLGFGFSMDSDDDFNVYLAGATRGVLQWDSAITVGKDSNINVPTVLVYKPDGTLLDHRIAEDGEENSFFSIDVEGDGSFAVTGKMFQSLTFDGITKTITDGGYHPYFLYYKQEATAISPLAKTAPSFVLYPNPIATNAILNIVHEKLGDYSVEIFNALGQKVLAQKSTGKTSHVQLKDIHAGIYYVSIDGALVHQLSVR